MPHELAAAVTVDLLVADAAAALLYQWRAEASRQVAEQALAGAVGGGP